MSEQKIPSPHDVDIYLLANDWSYMAHSGNWAVYKREVNGHTYELEVPLRADARDYARVCMMAIGDLEKVEGRKGSDIVADILDSKRRFERSAQMVETRINQALGLTVVNMEAVPVTKLIALEERDPGVRPKLNKRQRKKRIIGRYWGRGYCQPSAWVRHNIYRDDIKADLPTCSHCLREPHTGQRRSADIKKRCRCIKIAGVE